VVDLVAEVNIEAMEGARVEAMVAVGVTKGTEEIKTKIEACKALVGKNSLESGDYGE
jgi:hypothetical protein